ncbi:hypothetical protein CJF42_06690 [Pseudoalteromonas sp. NBT06-2]|uniref:hypothetical protein n=1 Tax=Pseudoalteromonas sp. NBT06-2 TaxID=2025950 RepID=UPI000BA662B9|nr:hypothetical protein [Pseudoalteromonas sp. NBT06-2]PAJ75172.1 hypothetical protein CJF42_06690 [Pseudoalteromonas sp. NBT06-2]
MQKMTSVITNFGVSDELQGIFYSLREMPSLNNSEQKKFKKHEIDSLSQNIVCRNYGKLCLELSYLCFAIINYQVPKKNENTRRFSPLLSYFWQNTFLSQAHVKNYFQNKFNNSECEVFITDNVLRIGLKSTQFDISISRVGLLAALLEFIVYIDPKLINEFELSLVAADVAKIKEITSHIQKKIYQFLTLHLSSAQEQRRFRFMASFLDNIATKESKLNSTSWLTDEYILNFWLKASDEGNNLGFKLFSSCFFELVSFHHALSVSHSKINARSSLSIGENIEAGEVSADLLEQTLVQLQQNKLEIDWLNEKPKFLTKNQTLTLKPIIECLPFSKKLALTVTRVHVFGAWQATIVQAARKKDNQLITQKLNQFPKNNYHSFYALIINNYQQVIDTLWALLHINHYHQQAQMFTLFNQLVTDKKLLKGLHVLLAQHVNKTKVNNINVLFNEMMKWQLKLPELNKTFKHANRIFNANNKTGFNVLPQLQELDIYHEGQDLLLILKQELNHFISHLEIVLSEQSQQANPKDENFRSDTSIFFNKLNSLYGVNDE